jgi:1,2-diacylglycerol 3-alpha-glucosyltransferase
MTAGLYAVGGSSIVIENLAHQLCKKGVEVTIGALKFKRIPPKGAYGVNTLPACNVLKLKKFLDGFDIVHSHHPLTNYLALISRKSFIYHYHGVPNSGTANLFKLSMLVSIKITNRKFDAIIAVSDNGAMELNRYFDLKNVHTIYNGVDSTRFRDRLGERFRKGTPQFLFVGNLYEHKKVEELMVALKKLIKTYPDAHLQIVGEGYTRKKLEASVLGLNLRDHVSFAGSVPHDDELPRYYSSCDVYITASRYELFPLPLIEAWACGKPVVASRIPAHIELLSKTNAGRLYAAGDTDDLCATMAAVYEHKDAYKSDAMRFARQHNWSTAAAEVLKVYKLIA